MSELIELLRTLANGLDPLTEADVMRTAASEIGRQTEIIVTLRQELKEAKARNIMYLSKIQEYEIREQ